MPQPEFVQIDNQTVRVTSLKVDETTGATDLVIVARGSSAATFLADLGSRTTISMEIPDESTATYRVTDVDIRSTGSGEQSMNRARFTLAPVSATPSEPVSTETQLDRIERKLDELLARPH